MAQIAKPTIEEIWSQGNPNGRKFKCVKALIVLSTQGGTSGDIPASLFGLSKIFEVENPVGSDDKSYMIGPSYDGSQIYSYTALSGAPANISGTIRLIVKGNTG